MSIGIEGHIDNRQTSSFSISIGTAMAIETLFDGETDPYDTTREIVKNNVSKYKIHYFNVRTLLRNMVSALENAVIRNKVLMDANIHMHLYTALAQECDVIKDIYRGSGCEPIVYTPNYERLKKNNHNYKTLDKLSDSAAAIEIIFNNVTALITKHKGIGDIQVLEMKHQLPTSQEHILITTHITADLLNYKRIRKLALLESHTGRLKTHKDWNSKYHSIGKLNKTILPFNELLYYILGDSSIMKPLSIKIRTTVFNIGMKYKWTPFTNETSVKNNILIDKDLVDIVKKIKFIY